MSERRPVDIDCLAECPMCSYSLEGLPDRHRCPECGADYDRDSEVVSRVYGSMLVRGFIAFMFLLFAFCAIGLLLVRHYLGFFLFSMLLISTYRTLRKYLFSSAKAVLSLKGVELVREKGDSELIEWDNIVRVDWPKWNLNICFWSLDGKLLKTIPSDFFGTTVQTKRFVGTAQRWLGWYRYLVSSGEIEMTK